VNLAALYADLISRATNSKKYFFLSVFTEKIVNSGKIKLPQDKII
jgi:hypothetical protein